MNISDSLSASSALAKSTALPKSAPAVAKPSAPAVAKPSAPAVAKPSAPAVAKPSAPAVAKASAAANPWLRGDTFESKPASTTFRSWGSAPNAPVLDGGVNEVSAAGLPAGVTAEGLAAMAADMDTHLTNFPVRDSAVLEAEAYNHAAQLVEQNYPNLTDAEKMDMTVALAFYAVNGSGQIENLSKVDSGQTQVLPMVRAIESQDPDGELMADTSAPAEADHDPSTTTTLNPEMDDQTGGQAFHTNFFVAGAYVAGTDTARQELLLVGNIYHETLDPGDAGKTPQDFFASATGQFIGGGALINLRNRPDGFRYAASAMYGIMSAPGTGMPEAFAGPDATQGALIGLTMQSLRDSDAFKNNVGINSPIAQLAVQPAGWVTNNVWVPALRLIFSQVLRFQGQDIPLGNSVR